jgi:hypothetical protein
MGKKSIRVTFTAHKEICPAAALIDLRIVKLMMSNI